MKIEVVSPGAAGGERRLLASFIADAAPDSTARVTTLKVKLPPDAPATIEIFVKDGDKIVSHNLYDLEIYDPQRAK